MARADGVAASVGLEFHHADAPHARTVTAHRLLHLAATRAARASSRRRCWRRTSSAARTSATTTRSARSPSTWASTPARVDEVLASEEYLDAVHEDIAQARAYGATGVPFFVVDQKYGVSGAQPTEVFSQLLERAWAESHPVVELVGRRMRTPAARTAARS